jgi:V-type H+-transporting ATPase subunit a
MPPLLILSLSLSQLLIPAEAAHATVAALGRLGVLQFKDLNADRPAFQRTFASHVSC